MTQKKYTDAQKSEALRLLEEEGIWSAVAATRANHSTIYRWHAAHVRTLKKTPEEIGAEEDEERILGVRLRRRMLLVAMAHVDRSDVAESGLEALRYMTAAGIAFDKCNKVGGVLAPEFVLTEAFLDAEIERLETELGRVAPNNQRAMRQADASEIDKMLSITLDEWETKIRAEVTEELTGKDALGRVVNPKRWDEVADNINHPNGDKPSEGDL